MGQAKRMTRGIVRNALLFPSPLPRCAARSEMNFSIKNNSLSSPVVVSQRLLDSTAGLSSIDTNFFSPSPPIKFISVDARPLSTGLVSLRAGCPETIPAHYDRHPPCLGKNCSRLICLPAPHAIESTLGTLFTAALWNQIRKPSRTIGTLGISPASA